MDFSAFLDAYRYEALLCALGGILSFLFYSFFLRCLDALVLFAIKRRKAAFCAGFMGGHISGHCRDVDCPHASHCCYFEKPKSIFRRILEKKNKPSD